MTFQLIPFQVAGPSYQSRSKPLSSQQTVNWYQQFNEDGNEPFVLMPFPGLKQSGSYSVASSDRGLARMAEALYQVKGGKLFSIDEFGTHTELATVPGKNRCVFANDGENLVIVTDLRTFIYSRDTGGFTESTVIGTTGAMSVDIINDQFLFTFEQFTYVANLNQSTKLFTTDSRARADINPDSLVRDFVFEQTIYRMGKRSVEAWYNNANVIPPISRLDGQVFNIGLKAKNSVASTDQYFYWLGDDNCIYRARSGSYERISTDAISNSLEDCTGKESAYAYTFTIQGQDFYCITFCQGELTLVLNESLGKTGWFQLSSGINDGRYQASSIMQCYDKYFAADESNGKIYTLDLDAYTNDGEILKRTRITKSINGNLLGAKGRRVQMSCVEFIMETGTGLITGQGENPRIMIEPSYDGGKTWDSGTWARVGRLGENVLKVEYFNLKSFYDCMLRITVTDPVSVSIYSGTVELRVAGK